MIDKDKNIVVHISRNVPLIKGVCPTCNTGEHSLILMDFIPHPKPEEGMIYMKCICCTSIYQTKVKFVSN